MSVRARWHTGVVVPELDDDPFDAPVEEVGEPIDLTDQVARLRTQLHELVRKEMRLHGVDITCPVKERDDTCCSACPISEAGTGSRKSRLCELGRRQERVLTELAVHACPPQ